MAKNHLERYLMVTGSNDFSSPWLISAGFYSSGYITAASL